MAKKKAKKKVSKKKVTKTAQPEFKEVQVNLGNVFQHMVGALSNLLLRVDRLQKTVDAVGELLATHAIKKD